MVWTNKDSYGVRRKGSLHWTIDKPSVVKPVITGTKEVDGKKYYVARDGKEYLAESFERNFGKVKLV